MTAAGIAAALGGAHRSGAWLRCRCPVHGSRGPTLALRDGDHGLIVRCWAGCEPRDVLAALRVRGLIGDGDDRPEPVTIRARSGCDGAADAARRIALARRIWDAAQDAAGSPVVSYLTGRGITLSPPPSLRRAPALRRPDGTCGPAMIAR